MGKTGFFRSEPSQIMAGMKIAIFFTPDASA